ncbi:mucin isoform X2, partial [Paramuricea clavata]
SQYGLFVSEGGLPVIGWNAGMRGFDYRNNEEYQNLPLSGTINAEEIDDYEGNLGKGRWIFATSPRADRSPRLECYDWFIGSSNLGISTRQCPRFETQASVDRRFRRQDRFDRICYARVFPQSGAGLRCCYRRLGGPLLKNLPEPGGFLSRNPLVFDVGEDDRAFENCCLLSDLCEAYFVQRPKQDGRFYRPRRFALGFGDPHYSNLDNMNYTFNGCGDFMFVISNDNQFQVQVRFSQAVGAGFGTVVSAVVLKIEGVDPIQINHNTNDSGPAMLLHINGAEYSDYDNLDTNSAIIGDKVSIRRVGDNQLQLVTEDDHSVVVTRETNNLVIVVALDLSLFGSTMGLLGNWSDTVEDDFVLPNGTNLGYPLTDEQIHFDFGENWRLTPGQNLFINTTADEHFFCPDDYTPIFVSNFTFPNSSIQEIAASICGGNINCAFDIAATMLPSFGQNTIDSFNVFEEEKTIAENNAPTFENSNVVFNLTVGEEFVYTLSAEDADGDNLEFTNTDLPPGATVERNGNNITFRWLVNSIQPFNLSFSVQDTKNASTILVPIINVCACENGGLCVQQATTMETQGLSFSQHQVLNCECATGFTGEFCEIVRDFCQTQSGSPCHPLANCTNSPTNYICGDCPSGYNGDGADCADIDECANNATHDCEMVCRNNAGSFVCECMDGYELNDDMKTCSDINECTTAHDCQQNCINEQGSFRCGCSENFIVDLMNPKNCVPRSACPSGNPCQQVCAIDSNSGDQVCSCNRGYTVNPNVATDCVDVNECESSTNLCNQQCTNTMGSFNCSCLSGYVMGDDRFTCQDVDECIMAEMLACNTSNGGEICVNLPGTFKCECNNNLGFVLIDGICQVPDDNQVVVVEPEEPPAATRADRDSSVQLRLPNFQSNK